MSERDELRKLVEAAMEFVASRYQSGFCVNDLADMRHHLESLLSAPEAAPPAAEPRHDYDSPPHSLTSGIPCPVCAAEPPAGEDWAHFPKGDVCNCGWRPNLYQGAQTWEQWREHIRTAAEREWAKTEAEMCEKYELALQARERKARFQEMIALPVHAWPDDGATYPQEWGAELVKYRNERIRALSTSAPSKPEGGGK